MIQYALLGLLREQRDYGYSLKRRFDARVGAYWRLNVGQVYQTLHALERAGLVAHVESHRSTTDRCGEHPPRRTFALTPKGERFLERWLQRPPVSPRPVRDELLVRFLVHGPNQVSALLGHLAKQEQMHRGRLARLLDQREHISTGGRDDGLVRRLNLEAAVRHTEAHLGWLTYCRRSLEPQPDETTRAAAGA
jgi:DNA-binding PadR family transcriptional regulator